jgi:enamine deaminase RidA (YjgF/YER057c/UK114 family)
VVVTRQNGVAWVYADHAVPRTSAAGVYEKTICSYQHLRRLLPGAGARFDQVLRTWLCLGGIVDDDGPVQRYQKLNRARADVYQHLSFLEDRLPSGHTGPAFPASTGIGTAGRSISLSALAVVSDSDDVIAVPLENPRQTAAYNYSAAYSPTSPKFSRGLAFCCEGDTALFISGTASITHSETRHPGDVVAQTEETLENITALISEDNLGRHGLPGRGTILAEGLAVARVYVKRPEDYHRVRAVCEQRLADVPATYVVADVCRPGLLVEIEGIAFSRLASAAGCPGPRRRCAGGARCFQAAEKPGERAPYCPSGCPELLQCPHAVLP